MITDVLVRRWAADRQADRDTNVQHVMKHITEEFNLDALHAQMHRERMGVTESDIQTYYEANRRQFGEQTFSEVRDQIRASLQVQQENRFVADHINRLKEQTTITRNFTLLEVPKQQHRNCAPIARPNGSNT
jgi:peptidyl-prolyl cis-trans isomerase D